MAQQISPQHRWQSKQRAEGRCIRCGKQAAESKHGLSQYCKAHQTKNRDYMREYMRNRKQRTS